MGIDEFDDDVTGIGVSVGVVTGGLVVMGPVVIGPVVVSVGVGSAVTGPEVEVSVGVGGIVVTSVGIEVISVGVEVISVTVGVDESGIVLLTVGRGANVGVTSGIVVAGSIVLVGEPKSLVAVSRILERIPPRSVVGEDVTVGSAEDEITGVMAEPVPSGVAVGAVPVPRSEERSTRGGVVVGSAEVVVGSAGVVVGSAVGASVVVGALAVPRRDDRSINGLVVGSASDVLVGSAVVVGALVGSLAVSDVGAADVEVVVGIKTELRISPREGKIPTAVVVGAELLSEVVVGVELSTPVDPAEPEKDTPSLALSDSGVGVRVGDGVPSVKIPPGPKVIPSAEVVGVDSVVSDFDESLDELGVG
jgi:hypothetical protein